MTRPTPGREAPTSSPGQHRSFPAALATALERSADRGAPAVVRRPAPVRPAGSDREPAAPMSPLPVPMPQVPVPPTAGPRRSGDRPDTAPSAVAAVRDAPRPAPSYGHLPARRMALVGGGASDTPDPHPGHLIETVGRDAAPLWQSYLDGGGPATRERLIEHYGSLVRGVASKLVVRLPASIELADLVQSGTFGLMEAVERFDPLREVRFDGYAAQRIRGAMLDELRAQDWVPRSVRARSREVDRAREAVALRTGRSPTDRELAAELGVGLRELRHALRPVHVLSAEYLDQTAGPGQGVADLVVDDTVPDPVGVAARRETSRELCAAIAQLGERDRLVLRLYYLEGRTLAEIGDVLGVTESRVCQLHGRMVSRLRGRLGSTLAG